MFYFAWVNNSDTTFGVEHQVEDEEIFAFTIEHTEGDFPILSIDIVNPRVGFLNPERSQWAWLSWRKPDNSVVALFHGRVSGVPADINEEIVTVELVGRPADYDEQKSTLAETLKVAPYWDPVFIDETQVNDPDVVLAARSALYHVGRIDKLVTISDIINGEDGDVALGSDDVFDESLSISYGSPTKVVQVEASVEWDQYAKGQVDFSDMLKQAFEAAGSPTSRVSSYTGQGLEASWPRFGDDIGGGWSVASSSPNLLNNSIETSSFAEATINPAKATPDITPEDWWETSEEGFDYWYQIAYDEAIAAQMLEPITKARFYEWEFAPVFIIQYEATRHYKEILTFEVRADIQDLVASEGDPEPVLISLASNTVADPIDPNGALPIVDISRDHYFGSDRSHQSIAYLLSLARAKLLFGARAVEISFSIEFSRAVDLSCRKNITLGLDTLPGGEVGGKVIGYRFGLNGDDGEFFGSVTIGCCIGNGNDLAEPNTGEPDYVEQDHVINYQTFTGETLQPIAGELSYETFEVIPNDDGIDFDNMAPANLILDTPASALLTFSGAGIDSETVTIEDHVYTLVASAPGVDEVLIGGDEEETARNIAATINADEEQAGIVYGSGTLGNAYVRALASDGIVLATAHTSGVAGNSINVSTTSLEAGWSSATLTGGDEGLSVTDGPDDQRTALGAEFGSVEEAIDVLNANYTIVELNLKPVIGGPFETPITLIVSDLMVPMTIDLEAEEVTV